MEAWAAEFGHGGLEAIQAGGRRFGIGIRH